MTRQKRAPPARRSPRARASRCCRAGSPPGATTVAAACVEQLRLDAGERRQRLRASPASARRDAARSVPVPRHGASSSTASTRRTGGAGARRPRRRARGRCPRAAGFRRAAATRARLTSPATTRAAPRPRAMVLPPGRRARVVQGDVGRQVGEPGQQRLRRILHHEGALGVARQLLRARRSVISPAPNGAGSTSMPASRQRRARASPGGSRAGCSTRRGPRVVPLEQRARSPRRRTARASAPPATSGCECGAAPARAGLGPAASGAGARRRRRSSRRRTAFTKPPARAPPASLASATLVSTAAWAGTRSSAVSWKAPSRSTSWSGRAPRWPTRAAPAARAARRARLLPRSTPGGELVRQPAVGLGQRLERAVERRLEGPALRARRSARVAARPAGAPGPRASPAMPRDAAG